MAKKTGKVVFWGTPEFAVPSLEAIVGSGRHVPCVITQPDQRGGRGNRWLEPAVKTKAKALGIPVLQPEKLKSKTFLAELKALGADVFVVAAYGRILPQAVIDLPAYILNVHASLLPRWRGAAPIARAILEGDVKTGVSIMKIVPRLDAGDVMLETSTPIDSTDTTGSLTRKLALLGSESLIEALNQIDQGKDEFKPQEEALATYAPPIEKEEARIKWQESAESIHRKIRAFQPSPGAFAYDGTQRIKLHAAVVDHPPKPLAPGQPFVKEGRLWVGTGQGALEILEIQKEGKTRQPTASFLQGYEALEGKTWS